MFGIIDSRQIIRSKIVEATMKMDTEEIETDKGFIYLKKTKDGMKVYENRIETGKIL